MRVKLVVISVEIVWEETFALFIKLFDVFLFFDVILLFFLLLTMFMSMMLLVVVLLLLIVSKVPCFLVSIFFC